MRRFICTLLAATAMGAVAVGATSPARADSYPSKTIKIIVPYAPGGTTDNTARVIVEGLKKELNATVIITNVSGGGGVVGMALALQAPPDGYTVGMYLSNTLVGMATGVAPFAMKDIKPACMYGDAPLTLTSKGGADAPDLKQFLASSSAKTVAIERGTLSQFAGLMINEEVHDKLALVNVGVGAEKRAAVLGGHVDALIDPMPAVISDYKAGQLKVLAVLTDKRLPDAPDVPTAKEQGVNVSLSQSNGFMFPAGTPQPVVDKFCSALEAVTKSQDFLDKMKSFNLQVVYRSGDDFANYMSEVYTRVEKLAKSQGYAK